MRAAYKKSMGDKLLLEQGAMCYTIAVVFNMKPYSRKGVLYAPTVKRLRRADQNVPTPNYEMVKYELIKLWAFAFQFKVARRGGAIFSCEELYVKFLRDFQGTEKQWENNEVKALFESTFLEFCNTSKLDPDVRYEVTVAHQAVGNFSTFANEILYANEAENI